MRQQFEKYLIKRGYAITTPIGNPSTVYDYQMRIENVCEWEDTTWVALAKNIETIIAKFSPKQPLNKGEPVMKINTITISRLRNDANFQFHTECRELAEKQTPEALKITHTLFLGDIMSKISMLVTVTFVVAILTTNALAGKKRGAATGALAGAAAGYLTEQKVKEIESRDFFEDDYIKLTADYLILKSTGDSESVALTLMDKNKVIQKAIRQLNASVARQTPKWENLSGIFEFEEYDVIGHIRPLRKIPVK